jgi:flagellar biosynthesis/type III secretory pathway protein FliH
MTKTAKTQLNLAIKENVRLQLVILDHELEVTHLQEKITDLEDRHTSLERDLDGREDQGRISGYDEGYAEGFERGYQSGYDDGREFEANQGRPGA